MRPDNNEIRKQNKEHRRPIISDSKGEKRRQTEHDLLATEVDLQRSTKYAMIFNDMSFFLSCLKRMRELHTDRNGPEKTLMQADWYAAAAVMEDIYEQINNRFTGKRFWEYSNMGFSVGWNGWMVLNQIEEIKWSVQELQKDAHHVKYEFSTFEKSDTTIDTGIKIPAVDFEYHLKHICNCIQKILRVCKEFLADFINNHGIPIPVID